MVTADPVPQVILCPACLTESWVRTDLAPDTALWCPRCKQEFARERGLPSNRQWPIEALKLLKQAKPAKRVADDADRWTMAILLAAGLIAGWGIPDWFGVLEVRGPEFLIFYAVSFLVLWPATMALRYLWLDDLMVDMIGFVTFEMIGVHRYVWGSAQGMERWVIMGVMMLIGGLLFFARVSKDGYISDTGTYVASCSASSCSGGGGCGGGGCGGGCGGCGG